MRIFLAVIFSVFLCSKSYAYLQPVDTTRAQLFEIIHNSSSDSLISNAYIELGIHYRYASTDSLYKYAELGYNLANKRPINYLAARASFYMSSANFLRGNYDQALSNSQTGLTYLTDATDTLSIRVKADLYQAEGTAFGSLGSYDLSLEKFFIALNIAEMMGFELHSRVTRSNIGVIYQRLEWYERALEVFLQLETEIDETSPVFVIIPVNLGLTYYELGDFEKAKEHLHHVLTLTGAVYSRAFGISHYKLGQIYTQEQNFDDAISAFEASIEVFKKLNNQLETVQSLNGLAKVYIELDNYPTALKFATQGYEISSRFNALPQTTETLQNLYIIAKALGKPTEALSYHEEYKLLADSMLSAKVNLSSAKMETEYNYKKREQELLLAQQKTQLINETTIREQRALLAGIVVALIFSVITLITLYRNYKQKRESNYLLSLRINQQNYQRFLVFF